MMTNALTTLPNGLRLAVHPMPSTYSASIVILIGVGARFEDEPQAGFSHFAEHMLFKGTARRPTAQSISDTVERLGGRFNAATSRETTLYYVKLPSRHAAIGIDLLVDMLRNSLFDPEEIEREKGVIVEEIAQGEDVPTTVGAFLLQRTIWGTHPLGRPVIGSRDTVRSATRDSLQGYLQTHYVPANTLVSVAGNVDAVAIIEQITELLGDMSARPVPQRLRAVYPSGGVTAALAPHHGQAHLLLAGPGVPLDHPDHMVFALLAEILGGGMSSRLFLEVRERRGLAYSVGAGAGTLTDHGTLSIHAGVAPAKALDALEVILHELHRLATFGVTDDELERVRGHYEGSLLLGLEDSYSMAARNARSVLHRGYIRSPEESLALIDAVTVDDIGRLAGHLLQPESMRLAVVGPFESIEPFAARMAPAASPGQAPAAR